MAVCKHQRCFVLNILEQGNPFSEQNGIDKQPVAIHCPDGHERVRGGWASKDQYLFVCAFLDFGDFITQVFANHFCVGEIRLVQRF